MKKAKLKIHSENILPILKKSLYSDKEIFVRELVSNACDALKKIKILRDEGKCSASDEELRVDITVNKDAKTITISDTGIGMTEEEVKKYIAQLAFSGAEEFMEKYKTSDENQKIIGHFGLGFFSSFMVSTTVHLTTKSYTDAPAVEWESDGSYDYSIGKSDREERGTTITLNLDDSSHEFLEETKLQEILEKYCRYLPYPIYLGAKHINEKEPVWIKSSNEATDEEYKDLFRSLYPGQQDPIFWIHLNVDYPFTVKGVLFFPKITRNFDFNAPHIKLFCNRVYVSDDVKDLIPEHLLALQGAIDSPDIPLNVSRSYLQMDSTVRQLAKHISSKVAGKLTSLHSDDKEKFIAMYKDIEIILKLGALRDDKFYSKVKSALLFKNVESEWKTLDDYIAQHALSDAKEGDKTPVYYTQDALSHKNLIEIFKEKGKEVLVLESAIDTPLMSHLESKLSCSFKRIDSCIDELYSDTESAEVNDALKESLSSLLRNDKEDEKDTKETSPKIEVTNLASDAAGFVKIDESSRRMREFMMMQNPEMADLGGFDVHTFVVNSNHPLISSIESVKEKNPDAAKDMLLHIYELALLEQKELSPTKLPAFIERSQKVLKYLSEK